jgi:hypothetical protein
MVLFVLCDVVSKERVLREGKAIFFKFVFFHLFFKNLSTKWSGF